MLTRKTQTSKIIALGGFFGNIFFGPLMKLDLPLMRNVLGPLAITKSVLVPSGLTMGYSKENFLFWILLLSNQ